MKRKKLIRVLALGAFGIAFMAALRFFAIAEPQTQLGNALFKSSYAMSSNKNTALQGYDTNLIKYNGGYIAEQVDKFLCSKLQNSTSDEELNAIADFYTFKAGGREGRYIFSLPAQTKQRITGLILSKLDNYTPRQVARALILIEVMRRGEYLGKANFGSTRNDAPSWPKYETWWEQRGLPEAKTKFSKWWRAYPTWQQKEKRNPLANSNLEISAP